MPFPVRCTTSLILLFTLFAAGCSSYYRAYGYGWVKKSPLPSEFITPLVLPAGAPSISQRFRPVDLSLDGGHKGFDILVPASTPVLAASDGIVASVETSILYGREILLNHGKVESGFPIQTRYYHLSRRLVIEGEAVQRGQLLGYSGASGLAALYPHLHFEVRQLNESAVPVAVNYIDPQRYWVDGVGLITCFHKQRSYPVKPVMLTYPVPCIGMD